MKLFWRLMGLIGIIFVVLSLPFITHHYSERARLTALFERCSHEDLGTKHETDSETKHETDSERKLPADMEAEALKGLKALKELKDDCSEVGLPCGSCSLNVYAHPELRPSWLDCLKARNLACLDE